MPHTGTAAQGTWYRSAGVVIGCRSSSSVSRRHAASPFPRGEQVAILADRDAGRQAIALLFGQALVQTADPGILERGRRVALNFADAVTQRPGA